MAVAWFAVGDALCDFVDFSVHATLDGGAGCPRRVGGDAVYVASLVAPWAERYRRKS